MILIIDNHWRMMIIRSLIKEVALFAVVLLVYLITHILICDFQLQKARAAPFCTIASFSGRLVPPVFLRFARATALDALMCLFTDHCLIKPIDVIDRLKVIRELFLSDLFLANLA